MAEISTGKMNRKEQAKFILLAGFLFFLPFFQKVSVGFIVALFLLWLISGDVKISLLVLKKDKNIFWFLLFYFAHIAGLLYTTNFSFAFFDLQTKFSFLLFPILFPALLISKDQFNKLKWIFISGCFVAILLCLFNACKNYLNSRSYDYFYYTYYSHYLHPTYFAVYLNLAIIFLLDELIAKWNTFSKLKRTGVIVLCYFFFATIIQVSARTANVVSYFSILIFLLIRLKGESAWMQKYFLSLILLVSFFLIQHFLLNHTNRFTDLETAIKQGDVRLKDTEKTEGEKNDINLRVRIWKNSVELIKRNPVFGVGTGDIKDELYKIYTENNFLRGSELHLNSHNQFLNTAVSLGLIGLISLLAIFSVALRVAIQNKDWIYFSFLLIIILNCMTESFFEKQNGILFFTVFNMLFYLRSKITIQTPNTEYLNPNQE